ncbi:unnamed protein product [Aphanomyces euteiches]|uniref:Uncharacterized protein n=1 Tax=Aphanomyces euteiches TaxID=100861 RepID=A0A6G0WRK5_9STRA|nr:hypothetical protein Ae201684_012456 [Aphanomyces euteiches]KAH9090582.1 hypothetical protein Ae201684P_014380 [Aphanomyces euteiches]KAH9143008.1 hypothetical protein AeRB84_012964 [Aphanomyces euteiches]
MHHTAASSPSYTQRSAELKQLVHTYVEQVRDSTMVPLPAEIHHQWQLLQEIKRQNAMLRQLVEEVEPAQFSYPIPDPEPTDVETTKQILAWYFSEESPSVSRR